MGVWVDGCMDGWVYGWMGVWVDGWMDGSDKCAADILCGYILRNVIV
jgi:hypothetical protein